MSTTLSNRKLQDYNSGARKPTFFVVKEFEGMKVERWTQGQAVTECTKHSTFFDEDIEPCWQCYKEFEDKVNHKYNRR